MQKGLLTATALCTSMMFMVLPALAQQVPYDWTGPYIGMTAGVVNSTSTVDTAGADDTFSYYELPTHYDVSRSSFGPGVTAGYNFQSGNVVYGIEGDASVLNQKTTVSGSGYDSLPYSATGELDSLATVRARLGIADDKALFYATAGLAGGWASFSTDIGDSSSSDYATASGQGFVFGPTLGAGVEYALTDKLSIKAEGKVFRLASLSGTGDTGKGSPTDPYTATYQPQGAMFSTGLNLHF